MFFIEYFPPGGALIEREEYTHESDWQDRVDELERADFYITAADHVAEPEEIEEEAA